MKADKKTAFRGLTSHVSQYLAAVVVVALVVLLCKPLASEQGYHIVSFILLFAVSLMAAFFGIGPVLLASTLSALVWNFFFIPPHNTLMITEPEDRLMFGSFFIIAILSGVLTNRIRRQEKVAREKEERTMAVFELTRDLSEASGSEEVIMVARNSIRKFFQADTFFLIKGEGRSLTEIPGTASEESAQQIEMSLAQYAFENLSRTGKYTDTNKDAALMYYPLKGKKLNPGVLVADFKSPLTKDKEEFWDTCVTQVSNALEREFLSKLAIKVKLLDESDRLYKTLFALVSHEFRIPIATIMGASDTLLVPGTTDDNRIELINEIFKASARLNHLIENLLNMSRLESGKIAVRSDWCEINDLLNGVVQVLKQELDQHKLEVEISHEMPLVRLDFGLMEHVIYNLLLNSCQYSPPGSIIRFVSAYNEGFLIITIEDNGPGFPAEMLDRVFNKFFRASLKPGGLGLGLSIVRGIVEAHKGVVSVENKKEGGAKFKISIPTGIPDLEKIKLE
ncbi:MAG: DUF4118 domain-containing protein [Bacteroidales bacterium]|nr:DUF4118 domain-containing protein [Bacteroidales bacterium]